MSNKQDLIDYISNQPVGKTLYIATSQYADTTTAADFHFDFHSTAQAVRGAIATGLIEGESFFRYYEVKRTA